MTSIIRNAKLYVFYGLLFSFFTMLLALTFTFYMFAIFDLVLSSYSDSTLFAISIAAVLGLVAWAVLDVVRCQLIARAGISVERNLSELAFEWMIKASAHLDRPVYHQSLRDIAQLRQFFSSQAIYAFFDLPFVPFYIVILFYFHYLFGLLGLALLVVVVTLGIVLERSVRKSLDNANVLAAASHNFIGSCLTQGETVLGLGMADNVQRLWKKQNDGVIKLQVLSSLRAGTIQALNKWIQMSIQVLVFGLGAYLTINGGLSPTYMLLASMLVGKSMGPVMTLTGSWKQIAEAMSAYKQLTNLKLSSLQPTCMTLPAPQGHLWAEAATFVSTGVQLLHGVSFILSPGESMGLIGPSGAGKSTLCQLLTGIWRPQVGKVRLDGADIFSWDCDELGRHVGYLPQDVQLFFGTIAENICRFGEVDMNKVRQAAMLAGTHDMIERLPHGYETMLDENGEGLSGGQRQRIGLARALYGEPKLVVLDEPNSNLDDEGEMALIRAITAIKGKSTVVIVTHKPSILTVVDKILLLRNGSVAMFGPQQEVFMALMQKQQSSPSTSLTQRRVATHGQ